MYYNYPIKYCLNKEVDILNNIDSYKQVLLCVYKVDTSGKFPFLKFLLQNSNSSYLNLPVLPVIHNLEKSTLINYSKVYLSGLLQVINFLEFETAIVFDGFYEYEDSLCLFYDITNSDNNIDETFSTSIVKLALTDEIINHRNVCNIEIEYETSRFFIKNASVNHLYDDNNSPYEIPVAGFVGKCGIEKINFTMMFGESAKDKSAILGPYYYFTDFLNASKHSFSEHFKTLYTSNKTSDNKHGIIRFALFTGKTKFIENMPNDPNDESLIKKQRLNDINLNQKMEVLTLRISDHDGNWAKEYDSAYLANVELDDGTILEEKYLLVLRDYCQQIPLSYHLIQKRTINTSLNNGLYENYSIV